MDVPKDQLAEALKGLNEASQSLSDHIRSTKLQELKVLDVLPDKLFDNIVALAAELCGTPLAGIEFIDADKVIVKKKDSEIEIAPRDLSLLNPVIDVPDDLIIVRNTTEDERFKNHPKVLESNVRFIAAVPLVTKDGVKIGGLFVGDSEERDLTDEQRGALKALSKMIAQILTGNSGDA